MSNESNNGYTGRVLEVDLSAQTTRTVPLADDFRQLFVGGRALSVALLFQYLER